MKFGSAKFHEPGSKEAKAFSEGFLVTVLEAQDRNHALGFHVTVPEPACAACRMVTTAFRLEDEIAKARRAGK